VIPEEFEYLQPSSLQEALQMLAQHGENAKVLAGGHSLIPLMKLRLASPGILVDLGRVRELKGISLEGGRVRIGALTTHAEVAASPVVQQNAPALAQAAGDIGDRQVRARGTIGGSLAHNDPAADLPAVMLALDAQITTQSVRGSRTHAAEAFFVGMLETAVAPDEVLTQVSVAVSPRSAYAKYPNPASHYAITGVGVSLQGNGTVTSARIGITGAADLAFRANAAEAALAGKSLSADSIAAAAAAAHDGRELLGDIHASAEYRSALIKVMTRRALEKLL
ncbi:MAG TPA: xanthine dehydrogenase family protein subunit M, partial [Dehalococcoidia bacterium]|nr:xanthine dehydrogenase family protein subunit M [Dehalococcoidia bacterium]